MSELQDLLVALDSVNREIEQQVAKLVRQAQQLNQAAAQASAVTHASSRAEGDRTAIALKSAQRAVSQAAQHLHQAALAGKGFVARNAGAQGGARGASPEFAAGANLEHVPPWATPRYLPQTPQQQAAFAQAVAYFGASNPGGWIGQGNTNYETGNECWTNNCGPCSRSFADTLQGVGVIPAYGDSKRPPGEYSEMWDAVGVQPTTGMSNPGRPTDPATFSSNAFAAVEQQLQVEGPGSVAIIGIDWDDPRLPQGTAGGHWFNAYVDEGGVVRWADEQIGAVGGWPPGYPTSIWNVEAVVRPSGSAPWKEVTLVN